MHNNSKYRKNKRVMAYVEPEIKEALSESVSLGAANSLSSLVGIILKDNYKKYCQK